MSRHLKLAACSEATARFSNANHGRGSSLQKVFIELPSILRNHIDKRLRYFQELHKIEKVNNDILLFSSNYVLVIQTLIQRSYNLSSVLTLDFLVKVGETELVIMGEHEILGKFHLKLGVFERMKEPLKLPKSQCFSFEAD